MASWRGARGAQAGSLGSSFLYSSGLDGKERINVSFILDRSDLASARTLHTHRSRALYPCIASPEIFGGVLTTSLGTGRARPSTYIYGPHPKRAGSSSSISF